MIAAAPTIEARCRQSQARAGPEITQHIRIGGMQSESIVVVTLCGKPYYTHIRKNLQLLFTR